MDNSQTPPSAETDNPQGRHPPHETDPPPGGNPDYTAQPGHQPESDYQPIHQPQSEQEPLLSAQTGYGTVPVSYVSPRYTWWEEMRRNVTQASSLSPGTFIFASGGMSLAWSIGLVVDYSRISDAVMTHAQVCWFIAVIIGACISTIFINKLARSVFYLIASVLVIINGALFVAAGDASKDVVIIIARYCDGIAFGLTVIPTIVAASEISIKRFRGYVVGTEQVALIAGMNILMTISRSHLTQGILALVFGGLALVFTFIVTIESPLYYLRKGNETEAMNALRRLQVPYNVTAETHALLDEHKQLLEEDTARGRSLNLSIGLIPMVKLCVFRAFVSMSLSFPLVSGYILASLLTNPDGAEWRFFIFSTMRLIGVVFAVYALDTLGRKAVSATSLLIGGGMLIGVGSLFSSYANLIDLGPLNTAKGLLIVYQLFAGLVAPTSSCYLGEAFSISVKPFFILIAVIFENIIQIIIFCAFSLSVDSVAGYGYALGTLQIVFGLFFIFGMPETKGTTLRQALEMFTKPSDVEGRA